MELFIPARINKENILGNGFGKRELRRLIAIAAIGLVVGILTASIRQRGMQESLLLVIGVTTAFLIVGYFLFVRNSMNQSIYDIFMQCIQFYRSQRIYAYRRLQEWR